MKLIFTDLTHSECSAVCHLRNNVIWHFKKWVMDSVDVCVWVSVCLFLWIKSTDMYVCLKHSIFNWFSQQLQIYHIDTDLLFVLFSLTCHEILHAGIHCVSEQSLIWRPLDSDTVPDHRKRRLRFAHKKNFQRALSYYSHPKHDKLEYMSLWFWKMYWSHYSIARQNDCFVYHFKALSKTSFELVMPVTI